MKRIKITPRKDWQKKVEAMGFSFHTLPDIYWDESATYQFEMDEILELEKATEDLHWKCLAAVQHIIENKLYDKFAIPPKIIPLIEKSWANKDISVYGRFDFSYNNGKIKMLEYNADTPTSLLESAVIQWHWLQDYNPEMDQFNSIHEKLIARWKNFNLKGNKILHFASVDTIEDTITTEYLMDTAVQAGLTTKFLYMTNIGLQSPGNAFSDLDDMKIDNIFKLYPWEWMIREEFSDVLIFGDNPNWIEPMWKMLLSNKAILPILWKLYPECEYLLPSYFADENKLTDYVKKPILAREGANVDIIRDGKIIVSSEGNYGEEGFICQEICELPDFDGNKILIGSWVIGDESAGICIRESQSLITTNASRFIPHFINERIVK